MLAGRSRDLVPGGKEQTPDRCRGISRVAQAAKRRLGNSLERNQGPSPRAITIMASVASPSMIAHVVLRYLTEYGYATTSKVFAMEADANLKSPCVEANGVRLAEALAMARGAVAGVSGAATGEEGHQCRALEARLAECRLHIEKLENMLLDKHHLLRVAEDRLQSQSHELRLVRTAAPASERGGGAARVDGGGRDLTVMAPMLLPQGVYASLAPPSSQPIPAMTALVPDSAAPSSSRPPPKRNSRGQFVSGTGGTTSGQGALGSPSRKRKKSRPHRVTTPAVPTFGELLQGGTCGVSNLDIPGTHSMLCGIVHGAENESGATMEGAREVLSLLQDTNLLTRVGEGCAELINTQLGLESDVAPAPAAQATGAGACVAACSGGRDGGNAPAHMTAVAAGVGIADGAPSASGGGGRAPTTSTPVAVAAVPTAEADVAAAAAPPTADANPLKQMTESDVNNFLAQLHSGGIGGGGLVT